MALLRQVINGVRVNTIDVDASADDLNALKSLLEGKVEEWENKGSGGSATAMPDVLNHMKFRVGKVDEATKVRYSALIRFHHIDPSKDSEDVKNALLGKVNADWFVSDKAEYVDLVSDRNDDIASSNNDSNKN